MPQRTYGPQVEIVERAIECLRGEADTGLIDELIEAQRGAATGLEYYGITKVTFEQFLASRELSPQTREAMKRAIKAVGVMYRG